MVVGIFIYAFLVDPHDSALNQVVLPSLSYGLLSRQNINVMFDGCRSNE
jgi:hypothetical protein